jgi:hypothetical protein
MFFFCRYCIYKCNGKRWTRETRICELYGGVYINTHICTHIGAYIHVYTHICTHFEQRSVDKGRGGKWNTKELFVSGSLQIIAAIVKIVYFVFFVVFVPAPEATAEKGIVGCRGSG